ncbi:NAD(P)-dependent dehydrogenase (short-subunit alcohol dehydrogenase family) [Nocardia tenerifensis]|uniref:NAD(P)-dependent dehydrogenase (Short-subunit alcohol dehydrogenase family) n=1 Tax=Nocardia tenerifensis TaxID=228006 RepID=A0A318K360_9NOCA|nr:SDR family oxidoreductase [Nocardia tenerifensis]PXX62251.1 NAD(P)-dependent dehydrogenase (short-subunit alcohol dehydrogenase family) [Nocardia tenerifensis]
MLGLRWTGFDVRGRVVAITGAGQGIGLELARILYRRGASVAMIDLDEVKTLSAARGLGERAFAVRGDVADRAGMVAALQAVRERFGGIDVVVANAGVTPAPATLRTMDPADFDRVLAVNLTGVFNTVHPALDDIVAARGHVVVVSSCAAFAPGMGGSPYMISKAGVEQLGRALRVELAASGATAGVAYFGIVDTPMTHHTLDEDDLGREVGRLLPWPLNRRITATQAAVTIADGITHRAARTIAPGMWEPYALLRGAINVALDRYLTLDPRTRALIRRLEQRTDESRKGPAI